MPKQILDEEVYKAVMQLVIERGYNGSTTKALAQAADMSEVTLFRKYGNKAGLVLAAMTHHGAIFNLRQAGYSGDIRHDLLKIVTLYVDAAQAHGAFFVTILSEMPRHKELKGALNQPLGIMQMIGDIVQRYQANGELRNEPPLHAVVALIGPLITMTLIRNAMPEPSFPPLDLEVHITNFLQGRQTKAGE